MEKSRLNVPFPSNFWTKVHKHILFPDNTHSFREDTSFCSFCIIKSHHFLCFSSPVFDPNHTVPHPPPCHQPYSLYLCCGRGRYALSRRVGSFSHPSRCPFATTSSPLVSLLIHRPTVVGELSGQRTTWRCCECDSVAHACNTWNSQEWSAPVGSSLVWRWGRGEMSLQGIWNISTHFSLHHMCWWIALIRFFFYSLRIYAFMSHLPAAGIYVDMLRWTDNRVHRHKENSCWCTVQGLVVQHADHMTIYYPR